MSDILDLIDGAIWDHGDAMRWTPEPVDGEEPPAEPWLEVGHLRRTVIDEICHWNAADIARIFEVPAELLPADRFEVWAWETCTGAMPNLRIIDETHEWHEWVARP